FVFVFFFSSRRRHTRFSRDWSSDVCSSDLDTGVLVRRVADVLLPAADQLQDDMEGAGVPGAAPRALAAALAGPESPRRRRYTRLDHAHGAHRVAVQAQTDP